MNDWPIKPFLILTFSIQILFFGLIWLNSANINIPLIRELISLILLTLPGVLILRILKIHNIGTAKTTLYTAGGSIASLMLIGLFMNIFYPLFGTSGSISIFNIIIPVFNITIPINLLKPISTLNIIITINFFILILCFISYLKDRNFSNPSIINVKEILSPPLLFLFLIPFLSIFGTYLLNMYGNNTLQLVLLLIISIFPIITLKWIPKKFYALVIFVLSLSLIWHTTLVSGYVWGPDLNAELIMANFVVRNGLWFSSVAGDYNAMLSIVMLAPLYSIFSNLSLVWCFKIIYPIIFSLVPVGLYVVYSELASHNKLINIKIKLKYLNELKITNNHEIAFLACIFFISANVFFNTLPGTARQEIGGLFLALILMLAVDRNIKNYNSLILLFLFGFSIVVSHYGATWILLLIIGLSILILLILDKFPLKLRVKNNGFRKYKILNYTFPLFFFIIAMTWYIVVTESSIFENVTSLGFNIIISITDILNPSTSQGLLYIKGSMPYFQSIERFSYIICNVLIAIGVIYSLFNKKINSEYKAMSTVSLLILIIGIVFPYFSAAMNTDRLFHINLFFLSIFFIIGFITLIKGFNLILKIIFKYRNLRISSRNSLYILAIFLLVFSIFNTAVIYQVFDQPKMGRFALDNNQDFCKVNSQEIDGIQWWIEHSDTRTKIFADVYKSVSIENFIYMNRSPPVFTFLTNTNGYSIEYQTDPSMDIYFQPSSVLNDSYVFFGTYNIKNNMLLVHSENDTFYIQNPKLENKNLKIYDNGGSWILKGS